VRSINRTNSRTQLEDGRTLTDLLAERDRVKLERSVLNAALNQACHYTGRYSSSEIRTIITLDVPTRQQRADELAQVLRLLDTRIQQTNWEVELIEG